MEALEGIGLFEVANVAHGDADPVGAVLVRWPGVAQAIPLEPAIVVGISHFAARALVVIDSTDLRFEMISDLLAEIQRFQIVGPVCGMHAWTDVVVARLERTSRLATGLQIGASVADEVDLHPRLDFVEEITRGHLAGVVVHIAEVGDRIGAEKFHVPRDKVRATGWISNRSRYERCRRL